MTRCSLNLIFECFTDQCQNPPTSTRTIVLNVTAKQLLSLFFGTNLDIVAGALQLHRCTACIHIIGRGETDGGLKTIQFNFMYINW